MMNTNWPDVFCIFLAIAGIICGLAIGAWLVKEGHPWFALLVMLIVGSIRMKTGG